MVESRRRKAVEDARRAALSAAADLARDGMRMRGWTSVDLAEAAGVPWADLAEFLRRPGGAPIGRVNAVMGVFGMRLLAPLAPRRHRP